MTPDLSSSVARMTPDVTAAVVTHNGRQVLAECLDSLLKQTTRPARVIVVDNASTDGTPDWLQENYPQIEVVAYPVNKGPAPARNEAIRRSDSELVLIVDDDAILHQDCLAEMLAAWERFPDASLWAPRVLRNDHMDIIQYDGVAIHYLMEAMPVNVDRPVSRSSREITPIHAAAGVCLLVSRSKALSAGLFDEDFIFGREDGEFTFRLTIIGHQLLLVPAAMCYHRVKNRGMTKAYLQLRNRWLILLTFYSLRTILLIGPALVLYEILLFLFLLMNGAIVDYLHANLSVLWQLRSILRKRSKIQQQRKVPDRMVLKSGAIYIRNDLVRGRLWKAMKSLVDRIFNGYWALVVRFI